MPRQLPPGPRSPWRSLLRLSSDPLNYITEIIRKHGNVASFPIGRQTVVVFNEPELVREVLVTHHRAFHKDRGIRMAKRLVGEGLLSSEGDFHKRQRRLSQPAFHKERIAGYAKDITACAERTRDGWRGGETLDMARAMNKLTLSIVAKTLFGSDVEAEAEEIGLALSEALEVFTIVRIGFGDVLDRLPLPGTRRWQYARARLDKTMYRMIEERRQAGTDGGDLLSMLLLATDSEGDGTGMSDLQLRDEAMTIFLAGHETTANALAWTWYLLAQNPAVEERLHQEIDAVLGDRAAVAADLPRLKYTEHVIAESMRLFPPAWGIGRNVMEPVEIGGVELLPGDSVLVSQWQLHRDARFFPNPLRFDPDRWEPEVAATRPRFSYFPFGGGPRICIGEGFAWMEAILVLATIAQKWRPVLVPDQVVKPTPRITLRPSPGIRMVLNAREAPGPAVEYAVA